MTETFYRVQGEHEDTYLYDDIGECLADYLSDCTFLLCAMPTDIFIDHYERKVVTPVAASRIANRAMDVVRDLWVNEFGSWDEDDYPKALEDALRVTYTVLYGGMENSFVHQVKSVGQTRFGQEAINEVLEGMDACSS